MVALNHGTKDYRNVLCGELTADVNVINDINEVVNATQATATCELGDQYKLGATFYLRLPANKELPAS